MCSWKVKQGSHRAYLTHRPLVTVDRIIQAAGPNGTQAEDEQMSATGNRGGGQRSKGERSFVATRVSVECRAKLDAAARSSNLSVSEYVEALIAQAVRDVDLHGSRLQKTA